MDEDINPVPGAPDGPPEPLVILLPEVVFNGSGRRVTAAEKAALAAMETEAAKLVEEGEAHAG